MRQVLYALQNNRLTWAYKNLRVRHAQWLLGRRLDNPTWLDGFLRGCRSEVAEFDRLTRRIGPDDHIRQGY